MCWKDTNKGRDQNVASREKIEKGGYIMTTQTECCCATETPIMILACSGGSNVGQLTNQVAVELTKEGWGKMFCLAGIGGHLSGFV